MMPMMDVFAPDVNFVSQRSVYPTASGGTVASNAGAMTASTAVQVTDSSGNSGVTVTNAGAGTSSPHGAFSWLGFLAVLGILVFFARKAGSEEDFRNIRPTTYNFLTITLTAIVGIVGLKVVAAKYHIPGVSDVILAA